MTGLVDQCQRLSGRVVVDLEVEPTVGSGPCPADGKLGGRIDAGDLAAEHLPVVRERRDQVAAPKRDRAVEAARTLPAVVEHGEPEVRLGVVLPERDVGRVHELRLQPPLAIGAEGDDLGEEHRGAGSVQHLDLHQSGPSLGHRRCQPGDEVTMRRRRSRSAVRGRAPRRAPRPCPGRRSGRRGRRRRTRVGSRCLGAGRSAVGLDEPAFARITRTDIILPTPSRRARASGLELLCCCGPTQRSCRAYSWRQP